MHRTFDPINNFTPVHISFIMHVVISVVSCSFWHKLGLVLGIRKKMAARKQCIKMKSLAIH